MTTILDEPDNLEWEAGLPTVMLVKQPAFVFYGRLREKRRLRRAVGGTAAALFTKDPFLWLINRISSSRAMV